MRDRWSGCESTGFTSVKVQTPGTCKKNLLKSLVGAVVLVEECGGSVESIAKFGDLGASGVGWDDGYRARVNGHDKSGDG